MELLRTLALAWEELPLKEGSWQVENSHYLSPFQTSIIHFNCQQQTQERSATVSVNIIPMCGKCSSHSTPSAAPLFPNHLLPKAQRPLFLQWLRLIGFKNDISLSGVTDSEQFVLSSARVTCCICVGHWRKLFETGSTEKERPIWTNEAGHLYITQNVKGGISSEEKQGLVWTRASGD